MTKIINHFYVFNIKLTKIKSHNILRQIYNFISRVKKCLEKQNKKKQLLQINMYTNRNNKQSQNEKHIYKK